MQSRYIAAIEIGSSTIKGAVATVDPESRRVTVIAREQAPSSGCVRYGWIYNEDEASRVIEQIIDRLESNPRVAPRRIRAVYVAIEGRTLKSDSYDVALSPGEERKITADTVMRLSREARESYITDNEIIEVFPRRFVIDSGAIDNPIGAYSRNLSATYNIITCRRQMIRNVNRVFEGLRSRLRVASIIVLPLAEADLVLSPDECVVGCALVDIGSDTTSVTIYKDGVLRYLSTIPMGSHNITRDLTALRVTVERAEAYKLNHGDAGSEGGVAVPGSADDTLGPEAPKIVHARAGEIVANIVANIQYSGLTPDDLPDGIVLVGGGANLRNLKTLVEEESGMRVRRGRPDDRVRMDATPAVAERSIDILATLFAASNINTSEQCLETPEVKQPAENRQHREYRGGYVVDVPDDDKTLLADDPDPEEDEKDKDLFDRQDDGDSREQNERRASVPTKKSRSLFSIFADRAKDLLGGEDEDR